MGELIARRVAVAALGDPRSSQTWSGIPAGLSEALDEMGVQAQGLNMGLPSGIEHALLAAGALQTGNRFDAHGSRASMAVRTRRAARLVRRAEPDGIVQVGTTFLLPPQARFVTLEDMTLAQARRCHPVFSRLSERGAHRWESVRGEMYRRAQMTTVASRWAADSLIRDYGLGGNSVAVVGFGANHRGRPTSRDWSTPRFLFVGLDWKRKGGPQLLRTFSRLREQHPQATLDVVGGHPRLDLPGVSAHGVLRAGDPHDRERLGRLFSRCTCLVLPSSVEPFGIVHVEAASAGMPSIGTSVGGPRDVIGERGGAVIEPDDEQALLQAMDRLSNPGEASRAGEAARERAQLYTWAHVAERMLRALGLAAPDRRPLAEFL